MWWHGWKRDEDFDQVAGSLIAGHLIECSSYVCGGYYSGFKDLFDGCENVGFPIAEVRIGRAKYFLFGTVSGEIPLKHGSGADARNPLQVKLLLTPLLLTGLRRRKLCHHQGA
jgi:hypothetical protein